MAQSAPTYAQVDLGLASPQTEHLSANASPHRRQQPPRTPSPSRDGRQRPSPISLASPGSPSLGFDGDRGRHGFSRIGRAFTSRIVRSARRGNLPFIIVFISCLYVFFSALAGIGYVDPEHLPSTESGQSGPAQFIPGAPVFDTNQDSEIARRHRAEIRRALEREWQKKKRPQDGTWLKTLRDDRAVRRVKPVQIPQVIREDPLPVPDAAEKKPEMKVEEEMAQDELGQADAKQVIEQVSGGTPPKAEGAIEKRDAENAKQDEDVVEEGDEVL